MVTQPCESAIFRLGYINGQPLGPKDAGRWMINERPTLEPLEPIALRLSVVAEL